jgi:hypothetical protein
VGLITRCVPLNIRERKNIPEPILTETQTQGSFRVSDRSCCNLVTETKFCSLRRFSMVFSFQATETILTGKLLCRVFRDYDVCLCNVRQLQSWRLWSIVLSSRAAETNFTGNQTQGSLVITTIVSVISSSEQTTLILVQSF